MATHQVLRSLPLLLLLLLLAGAYGCSRSESVDLELPSERQVAAAGSGAMLDPQSPLIPSSTPSCAPPPPGGQVGVVVAPPKPALRPPGVQQTHVVDPSVPPISGGTMLTTADGSTVVAADPDRDQLYFVDAPGMRHLHTRALHAGDEPGRVVEDASGRIHVVLRRAGAIATLGREPDSAITWRPVCALPRGIAYDAARDQLHVACAEGKLVTLGAAPTELAPARTLELGDDLRDVLVRGDKLFVSRFRSAELLILNQDGALQETRKPSSFAHDEQRGGGISCPSGTQNAIRTVHIGSTPNVAWRMIDVPTKGVSLLHQRSRTDEILVSASGYGFGSCAGGIVQAAVSLGLDSEAPLTADFSDATLAVDFVVDPDAALLVLIAPGNYGEHSQLRTTPLSRLDRALQASPDGTRSGPPCAVGDTLHDPAGQATALTLSTPYQIAVQEREPAAISFIDLRTRELSKRIELGGAPRYDTGHAIFHARTSAGLACASCHPEAGDDGHVWTFEGIGPRRTQALRGGLLGTEPLHWNGDMANFQTLMKEVFVGRMAGLTPTPEQADALAGWLDAQPALHAAAADMAAAERGKLLFESAETRCSHCHAGPELTNNLSEDVGTGAVLQVPSLRGVRFRTPLMHDGCAATLADRFANSACGGGDRHGTTSHLSAAQVSDLTAYLETL